MPPGTAGIEVNELLLRRVWQVTTVMAVLGAGVLLVVLVKSLKAVASGRIAPCVRARYFLALATVALFLLPIAALPPGYWFDRYVITLLPPLMVLCAAWKDTGSSKAGVNWRPLVVATLLVYGWFTVTGTHDYLSWNRHRWQVLNTLVGERHVAPENIHGGFEFNGWFFGQRIETCNPGYREGFSSHAWSDFVCISDRPKSKYRVVTGPRQGYELAERHWYRRWLPPVQQAFYLLHR